MHAKTEPEVSTHVAAEAADWMARLRGPARSQQMAQECLDWLSRSPEHRHAFERCMAVWDAVRGVAHAASNREPGTPGFAASSPSRLG